MKAFLIGLAAQFAAAFAVFLIATEGYQLTGHELIYPVSLSVIIGFITVVAITFAWDRRGDMRPLGIPMAIWVTQVIIATLVSWIFMNGTLASMPIKIWESITHGIVLVWIASIVHTILLRFGGDA